MYRLILFLLFFCLPLLHAQVWTMLGGTQSSGVAGNYEFFKSIMFQIFVSLAFFLFVFESFFTRQKISFPRGLTVSLGVFFCYLFLTQIFSLSPLESFYGSSEKGHGLFLWFHLFLLFIILVHTDKTTQKRLLLTSIISASLVCILALSELFFPSFEYGALGSRALGTLGHPNYLACYLLLFLPILLHKIDVLKLLRKDIISLSPFFQGGEKIGKIFRGIIEPISFLILFVLFSWTLLFTQSAWALFLGFLFVIFFGLRKIYSTKISVFSILIIALFLIFLIGFAIFQGLIPAEKIHSFLSRIYIWQTTIHIIFSSPKIFLFGGGLETLPYFFSSFKVPEMYIYENFGFTADRTHSIFVGFFYHLGLVGSFIVAFLSFQISKHISMQKKYILFSLLLFLSFGVFHFYSITSYTLAVLLLSMLWKNDEKNTLCMTPLFLIPLVCISLFSTYHLTSFFQAEMKAYEGDLQFAYAIFPDEKYLSEYSLLKKFLSVIPADKVNGSEESRESPLGDAGIIGLIKGPLFQKEYSELFYENQIQNLEKVSENCEKLIEKFPSVENYFYCGKILEKLGYREDAKKYYEKGLSKLPDLWNSDSVYWKNFLIKNTVTGNRFFSEKFSDVKRIVERLN